MNTKTPPHYLVVTRSKPRSELALQTAGALATVVGASLSVLVVARRGDKEGERGKGTARAVAGLQQLLPAARIISRPGTAAEATMAELASGGYSLVILGQHLAPGRLRRLFKKPVTRQVIEETDLPVLIVKETTTALNRLLLCDGGAEQEPILERFRRQLPEFLEAAGEATVLHVMSQISAQPGIPGDDLRATAEELIAASAHEGEILEQDVEQLQELDMEPRPLVRHGLVVDEIVAEAESGAYDLVVIGAHRQEPWTDLLLDDLATQIIREIDQTVLIIK